MNPEHILENLINFESRRIAAIFCDTLGDDRSKDVANAKLAIMRYMGKRDAYYLVRAILLGHININFLEVQDVYENGEAVQELRVEEEQS